jgi:phosphatidylserine decarboxylase
MRWIPNLIMSNERVLIFGERAAANTTGADNSGSKKKSEPVMAMALVGATCVGSIGLCFDERVATNIPEAPETSVLRDYGAAAPTLAAGDEVGFFKWGSCVVLVADVPKQSEIRFAPGSEVRQGQRLV